MNFCDTPPLLLWRCRVQNSTQPLAIFSTFHWNDRTINECMCGPFWPASKKTWGCRVQNSARPPAIFGTFHWNDHTINECMCGPFWPASKKWQRDMMSLYVSINRPLKLDGVRPLGTDTWKSLFWTLWCWYEFLSCFVLKWICWISNHLHYDL